MFPHLQEKRAPGSILQQDNDPKHTSLLAQTFISDHDVEVLTWPPPLPDLNPIENLWELVNR